MTIYAFHEIVINHWHWYETIFDFAILLVGVLVGWLLRTVIVFRHIADGFRHLADVSDDRTLQGPDIYTAFAWTARGDRKHLMRRHRERFAHYPAPDRP